MELNWQNKEKLGIHNLLEQIGDLSQKVVAGELKEIHSKIDTLSQMGLIQDNEKIKEMKEKMKNLGIEFEVKK
jgi:hypothetical protein